MRRVKAWAVWAIVLGSYVLGGLWLGWEVSALKRDLIPLLFGAMCALVIDANLIVELRKERLAKRLREWGQNEEMIDWRYTQHGRDCMQAAEILDEEGA